MRLKKNIEAIHQHDIKEFFSNLGVWEDFVAGKIKCEVCNDVVGEKNVGAVYPCERKILFVCAKLECLATLQN